MLRATISPVCSCPCRSLPTLGLVPSLLVPEPAFAPTTHPPHPVPLFPARPPPHYHYHATLACPCAVHSQLKRLKLSANWALLVAFASPVPVPGGMEGEAWRARRAPGMLPRGRGSAPPSVSGVLAAGRPCCPHLRLPCTVVGAVQAGWARQC